VDSILITFGGTDPKNLTGQVLETVVGLCEKEGIRIYVVAGVGYAHKEELRNYIRKGRFKGVEFTHATGVIAGIMEKTRIAIASNGRTVYELAHMNIPSIVISHHEREMTHSFSKRENGFINLGVYNGDKTKKLLLENLHLLIHSSDLRRELFRNTRRHNFSKNKERVTGAILGLLL
jgi:Spore coat polysaccharide biosynthesis protein, predicted glycosyltransferase